MFEYTHIIIVSYTRVIVIIIYVDAFINASEINSECRLIIGFILVIHRQFEAKLARLILPIDYVAQLHLLPYLLYQDMVEIKMWWHFSS